MSEKKSWKVLYFLGYVIPILLVVYVLSIGPAFAIIGNPYKIPKQQRDADSFFSEENYDFFYAPLDENYDSFYAPLIWAAQKNSYIKESLDSYGMFCYVTMHPD